MRKTPAAKQQMIFRRQLAGVHQRHVCPPVLPPRFLKNAPFPL